MDVELDRSLARLFQLAEQNPTNYVNLPEI